MLVRNFLEGKMLHDGDEPFLGKHIVLQLHVEGATTLGIPSVIFVLFIFDLFHLNYFI